MLVRSQNKKELLKFSSFLVLSPTRKNPLWGIGCITDNSEYFLVAEYSSEAKAIKAIDMVEEHILGRRDKSNDFYRNSTFQFPLDEDVKV